MTTTNMSTTKPTLTLQQACEAEMDRLLLKGDGMNYLNSKSTDEQLALLRAGFALRSLTDPEDTLTATLAAYAVVMHRAGRQERVVVA